jgi:hypothetical protein
LFLEKRRREDGGYDERQALKKQDETARTRHSDTSGDNTLDTSKSSRSQQRKTRQKKKLKQIQFHRRHTRNGAILKNKTCHEGSAITKEKVKRKKSSERGEEGCK